MRAYDILTQSYTEIITSAEFWDHGNILREINPQVLFGTQRNRKSREVTAGSVSMDSNPHPTVACSDLWMPGANSHEIFWLDATIAPSYGCLSILFFLIGRPPSFRDPMDAQGHRPTRPCLCMLLPRLSNGCRNQINKHCLTAAGKLMSDLQPRSHSDHAQL